MNKKVIRLDSPRAISEIKQDLDSFVGSRIRLKANRGRNRIIEREGVLESTYPNIFIVKINERKVERRVSYSYADVLTETVELYICDEEDDNQEIKIAGAHR
ncbi:MAG: Veg family protein [Candidatus Saccharibacteria bacterium]